MGHELLFLGVLLVAAGMLGRLGRRAGIPTIPLFMLVGLGVGIYGLPGPLAGDPESLELLAALGLVLLLFHLGLEFDLEDFTGNAGALVTAGAAYILLNVGTGLLLGLALGWGGREALVVAGITGISSSAIVTKVLVELNRLTNRETPLILGVIVVEDLFLAVYLAALVPLLGPSASMLGTLLRLVGAFLFVLGMFVLARRGGGLVGRAVGSRDDELLTIAVVGFAVLLAGTAEEVGISDAIGAFLMGLAIGGTSYRDRVAELVRPLRDVFAAVFFVAFGLSLDAGDFGAVLAPVAAALLLTLAANLAAGLLTTRLRGLPFGSGVNAGLTLLSRGEFALILATLATAAGLDDRIGPFTGLYVLVLAVAGPILTARSPQIGAVLSRRTERTQQRTDAVPAVVGAASAGSTPGPEEPPPAAPGPVAGEDGLVRLDVDPGAGCGHVDRIVPVRPSAAGCEDCLRIGGSWVHLRVCMACGHMGCCDSSPNRHATGHWRATEHPVVRSAQPGQTWGWCYEDEIVL